MSKVEELAERSRVVGMLKELWEPPNPWSPLTRLVLALKLANTSTNSGERRSSRFGCCQAVGNWIDVSRECVSTHQKGLKGSRAPSAKWVNYEIARTCQFVDPLLGEPFREHREVGTEGVEPVPHARTFEASTASAHLMQRARALAGNSGE